MAKTNLTAARLRERLAFNPDTGIFMWRTGAQHLSSDGRAGSINHYGRRTIKVDGTAYYAYRLAWLYVHGVWPEGVIDHINGVVDDNRIKNLRDVTHNENAQNQRRGTINSKSGLLGVSPHRGKWQACIELDGVKHYLGVFATKESAHTAYVSAKRDMHTGCTI